MNNCKIAFSALCVMFVCVCTVAAQDMGLGSLLPKWKSEHEAVVTDLVAEWLRSGNSDEYRADLIELVRLEGLLTSARSSNTGTLYLPQLKLVRPAAVAGQVLERMLEESSRVNLKPEQFFAGKKFHVRTGPEVAESLSRALAGPPTDIEGAESKDSGR